MVGEVGRGQAEWEGRRGWEAPGSAQARREGGTGWQLGEKGSGSGRCKCKI